MGGLDFVVAVAEREAIVGLFVAHISLIGRRVPVLGGILLLFVLAEDRWSRILGFREGFIVATSVVEALTLGAGEALPALALLVPLVGDDACGCGCGAGFAIREELGLFLGEGVTLNGRGDGVKGDEAFCIFPDAKGVGNRGRSCS